MQLLKQNKIQKATLLVLFSKKDTLLTLLTLQSNFQLGSLLNILQLLSVLRGYDALQHSALSRTVGRNLPFAFYF